MKIIEYAANLKLLEDSDTSTYYIIKQLEDKSEIIIAKIGVPFTADIPCILTIEDHLQNYILTFEDYQNFIKLVDEAYFRFEQQKDDR